MAEKKERRKIGKGKFRKEEENKGRDDVYWEWERKAEKGKKERKRESAGNKREVKEKQWEKKE